MEEGVRLDLAEIGARDRALAKSGLAASALALAQMIDDSRNSATSRSMCARALREALDRLRELAPPAEEADHLDDLKGRASIKLAGKPAA